MIPEAHIIAWRQRAPWPDDTQIEQDLILSRLMVEIARHDLLGPELSLRGGTCLHKLHFPEAARYSEDLDYVRSTNSGIKPYLAALREVAADDLLQLVVAAPATYDVDEAADVVISNIGALLRNAPDKERIEGGRWRR